MKPIFGPLVAAAVICGASSASAITFSNVSYTDNSVTFTANGVMDSVAGSYNDQFTLLYGGDIVSNPSGTVYSGNAWSGSIFDGQTFGSNGFTGGFSSVTNNYTWSRYDSSLLGATADNVTVTVTFGAGFLNTLALNPIINFMSGNGADSSNPLLLQQVNLAAAVPVPAALPLLGLALAGLFGVGAARRRKAA